MRSSGGNGTLRSGEPRVRGLATPVVWAAWNVGLDPIKLVRPADDLERQFTSIRELTARPFAINFVVPYFEERAERLMALFDRALSTQPAVVSFALGDPGHLVRRVHDAGGRS